NVAEQLADAMLRIEPENMRILNGAALVNFGLTPEDPAWREMKELKTAQGLGLDRAEYMRRKALAIRSCSDPATFCAEAIMGQYRQPRKTLSHLADRLSHPGSGQSLYRTSLSQFTDNHYFPTRGVITAKFFDLRSKTTFVGDA